MVGKWWACEPDMFRLLHARTFSIGWQPMINASTSTVWVFELLRRGDMHQVAFQLIAYGDNKVAVQSCQQL